MNDRIRPMQQFHPAADSLAAPTDIDRDTAIDRLVAAATGAPPTQEQRDRAIALRDAAVLMGSALEAYAEPGRDSALAWTALEDCLMRATRSIYSTHTED